MDDATLIDIHEDLVQNLQELSKDAPKIKEMYSSFQTDLKKMTTSLQNAIVNAKTEINKAEISGTKKIAELSASRKKQIDTCLKELDEVVDRAETLQETLGISVDSIQEFEERINDFEAKIESLKKELKKQTSLYKKLEERVSSLEENMSDEDSDEEDTEDSSIEIDYDEVSSAAYIHDKYIDEIGYPIVIEKPNYKNEYCFRVTGHDDENQCLTGDFYQRGKIYRRNKTFPYDTQCRMFHGSTLKDVIKG